MGVLIITCTKLVNDYLEGNFGIGGKFYWNTYYFFRLDLFRLYGMLVWKAMIDKLKLIFRPNALNDEVYCTLLVKHMG